MSTPKREWFQSRHERIQEKEQLRLDTYNGKKKKKLSKEEQEEIEKKKSSMKNVRLSIFLWNSNENIFTSFSL